MKAKYILILSLMTIGYSCTNEPSPAPQRPVVDAEPGDLPQHPEGGADGGSSLWQDFVGGRSSLLPDFSYAGYRWGEEPLPDVSYPVFNICDYGAIADDGLSDRDAFERTVAAAVASGRPAVIYVPKGRFELHDASAPNKPIIIDADNIVLRGASRDASILCMSAPGQAVDGSLWNTPELLSFRYSRSRSDDALLLGRICSAAKAGSHDIELESAPNLTVGQRVLVKLAGDRRPEAIAAEVAPHAVDAEFVRLSSGGVQVAEYHSVERVDGRTIRLREPLGHDIDPAGGWTLHSVLDRHGCGVEDLCFEGAFVQDFVHHKDALHDSGFRILSFMRQAHGWVRRCSFINVSEAISVMISCNVSVDNCIIAGNAGHSAVRSQASTNVLIANVDDRSGQFHSVGVSKTASFTVLHRCTIGDATSFESHCSQPRNTLIDNCRGGLCPNHAGGDAAEGPNHLRGLVIWNYDQTAGTSGTFPLWRRNNRFVMPVIAGFCGSATFDPSEATVEEYGKHVEPLSLYEAQLKLR